MTEFDESLWQGIVHQIRVHSANEFTYVLKDGNEEVWAAPKGSDCCFDLDNAKERKQPASKQMFCTDIKVG